MAYGKQAGTCPWWEKGFRRIYVCYVIPGHAVTIRVLISEWLNLLGCSWHVVLLERLITSSRHLFLGTVSGLPGTSQNGAVCFHSRQYTLRDRFHPLCLKELTFFSCLMTERVTLHICYTEAHILDQTSRCDVRCLVKLIRFSVWA